MNLLPVRSDGVVRSQEESWLLKTIMQLRPHANEPKKIQSHKQHADAPSQLIADVVIIVGQWMNNNMYIYVTGMKIRSGKRQRGLELL